jgi:hypothetical protein
MITMGNIIVTVNGDTAYTTTKKSNAVRKATALAELPGVVEIVRDGVTLWRNGQVGEFTATPAADEAALTAREDAMVGDATDEVITVDVITLHDVRDDMTGTDGWAAADEATTPTRDGIPTDALRGTWARGDRARQEAYRAATDNGPVLQEDQGEGWTDVRTFANVSIAARQARVLVTCHRADACRVVRGDGDTLEVLWTSADDEVTQAAVAIGQELRGPDAGKSKLPLPAPRPVKAPKAAKAAKADQEAVTLAA